MDEPSDPTRAMSEPDPGATITPRRPSAPTHADARENFLSQLERLIREYPSWSPREMITTPLIQTQHTEFELLRQGYEALDVSDQTAIRDHWLEIACAQPGVNAIHHLLSIQYEYILDRFGLLNNAYADRNHRDRAWVEQHNEESSDKWTFTQHHPLIARVGASAAEQPARIDDTTRTIAPPRVLDHDELTPTQPIRLVHDAATQPLRPGPADAVPVEIDDGAPVMDVARWVRRQKRIGLMTGFGVASGLACAAAMLVFFVQEAPTPTVNVASTADMVESTEPRVVEESGVSAARFLPTPPDAPLQIQTENDLLTVDCKVTDRLGKPVKTETLQSDDPKRPRMRFGSHTDKQLSFGLD